MESETTNSQPDEAVAQSRQVVLRQFGLAVLQLQQYELLLKDLIIHSEYIGPTDTAVTQREQRSGKVKSMTLGGLVTEASKSLIRTTPFEDVELPADKLCVRVRIGFQFSPEDGALILAELKQLIELRNGLVHHFMERFDLFSVEGCNAASIYLDESCATIKTAHARLTGWAKDAQQLQQETITLFQSESFRNAIKSQLGLPTGATDDPT